MALSVPVNLETTLPTPFAVDDDEEEEERGRRWEGEGETKFKGINIKSNEGHPQQITTRREGLLEQGRKITLPSPAHRVVNRTSSIASEFGSIELRNFSLDLRQCILGTLPHTGLRSKNLIRTPVTVNVEGSFSRYDMLNSFLLDAGLRRLVARALRVRVRTVRDLADGAIMAGRTWNLNTPDAPLVEVEKLDNVEFDEFNRAIITGRAKVSEGIRLGGGKGGERKIFKERAEILSQSRGSSMRTNADKVRGRRRK